jgi:hypothetical protein
MLALGRWQQLQTAAEAFRETAVRLLRVGEIHPQVIVVAAAQAAGEMGAGLAAAFLMEFKRRAHRR